MPLLHNRGKWIYWIKKQTCSSPLIKVAINGEYYISPQNHSKKYSNIKSVTPPGFVAMLAIIWKALTRQSKNLKPKNPIKVNKLQLNDFKNASDKSLWRLGHSSVLLKINGKFWLTDPVLSKRASPIRYIGPKRYSKAPVDIQNMPEIEAVILSHDHYDHLDKNTIMDLNNKTNTFITALGVGDILIKWGIDASKIHQLEWWSGIKIGSMHFIATPAQHFSGRSPFDKNTTLWTSWVIRTKGLKIFFSGDGGFSPEFKKIGEKYGPFDFTLIENGAYDKAWPDYHMTPQETIKAHIDLKGRWLIPIHNSTFVLAFHPWNEPMKKLLKIAKRKDISVLTPGIGYPLNLSKPAPTPAWWIE